MLIFCFKTNLFEYISYFCCTDFALTVQNCGIFIQGYHTINIYSPTWHHVIYMSLTHPTLRTIQIFCWISPFQIPASSRFCTRSTSVQVQRRPRTREAAWYCSGAGPGARKYPLFMTVQVSYWSFVTNVFRIWNDMPYVCDLRGFV